ncbi:MAG: hypothetical protein ABIA75_05230 [Candidatus Neomarinimicrobiota bacterium]
MLSRKILAAMILTQSIWGQGIYNAIGTGSVRESNNAAALGIGGTGLLPSFSEKLSLANPVTWPSSRFALLTASYGGVQLSNSKNDLTDAVSDINRLQIILPIKNTYALGLDLSPLTSNDYLITGAPDYQIVNWDTTTAVFIADTLNTRYHREGAGGLLSLRSSLAFPIGKFERSALSLEFIFGSTRRGSILDVNNEAYIYNRHDRYNGIFVKYYLESERFSAGQLPLHLFLSLSLPLQPLLVESTQYHLYEDGNANGFYDSGGDFPGMSVDATNQVETHQKIQSPVEFSMGFDLSLAKQTHLQGEYYYQALNTRLPDDFFSLQDLSYKNIRHLNIGAVKFARSLPREWYEYFHYRMGIYHDSRTISSFDENLTEFGASAGLGFKFGLTGNQIDIAYSIGMRSGPLNEYEERVEKFKVQITIGDIWFVKRRSR